MPLAVVSAKLPSAAVDVCVLVVCKVTRAFFYRQQCDRVLDETRDDTGARFRWCRRAGDIRQTGLVAGDVDCRNLVDVGGVGDQTVVGMGGTGNRRDRRGTAVTIDVVAKEPGTAGIRRSGPAQADLLITLRRGKQVRRIRRRRRVRAARYRHVDSGRIRGQSVDVQDLIRKGVRRRCIAIVGVGNGAGERIDIADRAVSGWRDDGYRRFVQPGVIGIVLQNVDGPGLAGTDVGKV